MKLLHTFAQSAEVWSVFYFHFNGEHLELSQDLQEGYLFVDNIYYIYSSHNVLQCFFLNAVVLKPLTSSIGFGGPKTTYV